MKGKNPHPVRFGEDIDFDCEKCGFSPLPTFGLYDQPAHCPECGHDNTLTLDLVAGGISTLSDDSQFQATLAADIRLRLANQSQDAWKEYIKVNRKNYPDYTIAQLGAAGFQWRQNYMIEKLCDQLARTTASFTDLLGVANDLRELSRAESVDEMSGIFKTLMDRPAFKKQAE